MQCFQKDPNLRVSARKLLKHAWIVGSRRTDAPVAKPTTNYSEAVEEVKQWNEALKSPTASGSFRASTKSQIASHGIPPRKDAPLRSVQNEQQLPSLITPGKGLALAKPKAAAEAFRSPETAGKPIYLHAYSMLTMAADDNWDDDFTTSISPSALHLPQFKPHDNFGGMLSSDRLKAFASSDVLHDENEQWDTNFEGDLMTIKPFRKQAEPENHDLETIRPYKVKPTVVTQAVKPPMALKSSPRKTSSSAPPRPKSPVKIQAENKFLLPHKRPSNMFREQSVEDYSDLFVENDSVFDRRLHVVKVRRFLEFRGTYIGMARRFQ